MPHAYRKALALIALLTSFADAAQQSEGESAMPAGVEVIVVAGQKTRVPLWQVSNGDHTLWILAYVGSVPKDIEWDYSQLEQVIQNSQEYISAPGAKGSVSPLLYLNPLNIVRGMRLIKRLQREPDGKTLQELVPREFYQRYAELKASYFPKEKDIEEMRPYFAGMKIRGLILENDSFSSAESTVASIEPVLEQVNKQLRHNDTLTALNRTDEDPCDAGLRSTSEGEMMTTLETEARQLWLSATEQALTNNASTFAMLNLSRLLGADGLLQELEARGYVITPPPEV